MNKPNIMLMANVAGTGKDTVADYLESRYNYVKISFAEPIYSLAEEMFGMVEKDRKLLQDIGQKMREIDPDVWAKDAFKRASLANFPVVISDVRQKNEFQMGLEKGYLPLRVVTNRDIAIERIVLRDGKCDLSRLDGPAEDGTREIKVPQIFNNGTVEELYKQVELFMNSLVY